MKRNAYDDLVDGVQAMLDRSRPLAERARGRRIASLALLDQGVDSDALMQNIAALSHSLMRLVVVRLSPMVFSSLSTQQSEYERFFEILAHGDDDNDAVDYQRHDLPRPPSVYPNHVDYLLRSFVVATATLVRVLQSSQDARNAASGFAAYLHTLTYLPQSQLKHSNEGRRLGDRRIKRALVKLFAELDLEAPL